MLYFIYIWLDSSSAVHITWEEDKLKQIPELKAINNTYLYKKRQISWNNPHLKVVSWCLLPQGHSKYNPVLAIYIFLQALLPPKLSPELPIM